MKLTNQDQINNRQKGFIMPVLLFTVAFIMIMITVIASFSLTAYNLASRESFKVNAQMTADAGLDIGISELNIDPEWTGTSGEVTLLDTPKLRTTYETAVLEGADEDRKILSVVARTYSPSDSTSPKITRRYELDLQAVTSGTGPSSVVTGVGGLIMLGNAKISGGDVVVNGKINMSNNSQIGLSTNPVNIRVAHQSCPLIPDSTYPQVCGPGHGEPITMGTTARIYGDVIATNQTNGTNMTSAGLLSGSFAPIDLPEYDRQAQIDAVTTTLPSTDGTIACSNNQTKSWPANIRITGDVSTGNGCTITINGDVWITGNVTLGNNASFIISDDLGADPPTIMVDGGSVSGNGGFIFGNNSRIVPNSSNTGAQVISFWSTASCSPDCEDVTGTDLANSQNVLTINLDNNGNASGTILWSRWSKARVANNGALGAVTGQTIELGNNAVINFTSSVPGSDNLVQTWVKRGYMRVYE